MSWSRESVMDSEELGLMTRIFLPAMAVFI
jgi:hypothetical protein